MISWSSSWSCKEEGDNWWLAGTFFSLEFDSERLKRRDTRGGSLSWNVFQLHAVSSSWKQDMLTIVVSGLCC